MTLSERNTKMKKIKPKVRHQQGVKLPSNVEVDVADWHNTTDIGTDAAPRTGTPTCQESLNTSSRPSSSDSGNSDNLKEAAMVYFKIVPLPFQHGAVSKSYELALLDIDENLIRNDLIAIIFLCADHLRPAFVETLSRGVELFDELERLMLLSRNDVGVLSECLYRIGRMDLLKKLGLNRNFVKSYLDENGSRLTEFRLLLHECCEELTDTEMSTIKFLLKGELPRPKVSKITSPQSLMMILEQCDNLNRNNVKLLIKLLKQIDRPDLGRQAENYQMRRLRSLGGNASQLSVARNQPIGRLPATANEIACGAVNNTEERLVNETCQVTPTGYRANPNDTPMSYVPTANAEPHTQLHKTSSVERQRSEQCNNDPNSRRNISVTENEARQQATFVRNNEHVNRAPVGHRRGNQDDDIHVHAIAASETSEAEVPSTVGLLEQLSLRDAEGENDVAQSLRLQGAMSSVSIPASAMAPETISDILEDDLEMPIYKMTARPRGICVIINNEQFYKLENDPQSKKMPPRKGSEVDASNLKYIFTKLEFKVQYYANQTETEMNRILIDISYNYDHSQYDCFVCCILTHGSIGSVYGSNGKQVPIKDLTACFRANVCHSLKGKPKMFFIQACQGKEKQEGSDILERDGPDDSPIETIPNEADFLLSYATLPGFVSYRSKTHGSWYITKLVEMLDKYHERHDLLSILIKVNEEVSKANAIIQNQNYKQSPAPLPTLRKKIYFKPEIALRR